MATLPTAISDGDPSHEEHHEALHTVYNLGATKGQLIVPTAAQVYAALNPGANDTVLVADSAQATGLKWQDRGVTDSAWTAATLTNSWTQVAGFNTVGYRRRAGVVFLRGGVTGGAAGSSAFTLPVGYRPGDGALIMHGNSANSTAPPGATMGEARIDIATSGAVQIQQFVAGAVWVSLDGICFIAGA